MKMKNVAVLVIALSTLTLTGCLSTSSGNVYRASEVKTAQRVTYGTVVSTRPVQIAADSGMLNVGSVSGAVLGGLAGNTIGGGSGRLLTTAGGVLLGGLAGNAIDQGVRKEEGVEIVVKVDGTGENIAVVQSADTFFSIGQRVRLVGSGKDLRVTP